MKIQPRYIGLTMAAIAGVFTSVMMSFVGLAFNYGFQPDFIERWLKAAVIGYVTVVPLLFLVIPRIQRFVMRHVG